MKTINLNTYKYYLSLDWAAANVAMGILRDSANRPKTLNLPPDVRVVRKAIKELKGSKILVIEETTTSHWLYVELYDAVDRIIICDPYRNSLMKDGPQNDKIDAEKLCLLLRSNFVKEVYHTLDNDYEIRKLVSAYEDLVKAIVRLKNQRSAIFRSEGKSHKKEKILTDNRVKRFVTEKQVEILQQLEQKKEEYEEEIKKIVKSHKLIQYLRKISGIDYIRSIEIYSTVIDAGRFASKYKYWSYCGLAKQYKESGGKIYHSKKVRCSKQLKNCYKGAANSALVGNNDIKDYYEYLLSQGLTTDKARHQIARYIAKVTYAILKNKTKYRPYQWQESIKKEKMLINKI
jgi:transposase